MVTPANLFPLWRVEACFGREAVERHYPHDDGDRLLSPVEIARVAADAPFCVWTDGERLWAFEAWARESGRPIEAIPAVEALARFGFTRVCAMRERGAA